MEQHLHDSPAHLGPLMGYCDHQIHKLMGRKLQKLDIAPMQCRVLDFLFHAQEEVNQRTLEQFLMVKPSTVNGIVSRLEEKGLIVRTTSPQDGRCRLLQLTEAGRSAHDQLKDVFSQVDDRLEQGFSPEELALLHKLLLRVAANLTQEPQEVDT